jgi:hypothetical protein
MSPANFISLKVKCPVCNKSLMDKEHKVDNEPGIKLSIESGEKKGTIWLSSVYDSFNYISDIDIPDKEIVHFYCPLCREELESAEICKSCDAPMIALILDLGGKVSFCSRKGCQDHSVGFEDLSVALKKLYQDFGEQANVHRLKPTRDEVYTPIKSKTKSEEEDKKEIIQSGSFLQVYCPHCKKSLIADGMMKLKIINDKNEVGYFMESPYLNAFTSKSTICLPEEKELKDIRCFHCDGTLKVPEKKCEKCGTTIARFIVSARTKMIDFYICSKKGCTWHGLNETDLENIRLEDSLEW